MSLSHTVGEASALTRVEVGWTSPEGADGFSIEWTTDSESLPDSVVDLPGTANSVISPELSDGAWYFHLRTRSRDGAWTSTVHLGPFVIEVEDPDAAPSTTLAPSETESADPAVGGTDGDERPGPPDDINPPVEIEIAQEGPCGWPPPRPPDGALLMTNFKRVGDAAYQRGQGYAFVLGTPHGAFVQFDDEGTLIANIEPRGEPPWPEWSNVEVTYTATTITIVVDETRWGENGPCTQRVTYVYRIGNTGEILDYMDGIPTDGIPDVVFDGVTANYEDGTFSMGGKLTFEDGVVVDLWLECSGLNLIEYRLIPIEVAEDGSFRIEEEFSDCVVINLVVAANGNQVTRHTVQDNRSDQ